MNNEKYYIRRFAKVFSEGVDKYWWFDIEKYIRLASKYDLDGEKLHIAIACVTEDENQVVVSPKTINRVLGFFNGEKEGAGNKSVTINTIKALGKALCDGDEYGLLIKIEPSNVLKLMKQADELWGTSDINYIYGMMNSLLYELEASSYYSYKPGTTEDGFAYYDMRLQTIRNEIDSRFWNKKESREKLYKLAEEEEVLIKSFSQGCAPERWIEANPKLRYFDCVFDFMVENAELYEAIKNGDLSTGWGQILSFNFYPTQQEYEERKEYFKQLLIKDTKQNKQSSIDRLYQNELVDAFRTVFENEFA